MPNTPPAEWPNTPPPGIPAGWPRTASFAEDTAYDVFGPIAGPPQMLLSPMPSGFEQTIGGPLPASTLMRMASEVTHEDTQGDVAYLTPIRDQLLADKQQVEQDRSAFVREADRLGFSVQFHAPSGTHVLNSKFVPVDAQQSAQMGQNLTYLQQQRASLEHRMREITQRGEEYDRLWNPVKDRIDRRQQQGMQTYRQLRQGSGRAVMMPPPPAPDWDRSQQPPHQQPSEWTAGLEWQSSMGTDGYPPSTASAGGWDPTLNNTTSAPQDMALASASMPRAAGQPPSELTSGTGDAPDAGLSTPFAGPTSSTYTASSYYPDTHHTDPSAAGPYSSSRPTTMQYAANLPSVSNSPPQTSHHTSQGHRTSPHHTPQGSSRSRGAR